MSEASGKHESGETWLRLVSPGYSVLLATGLMLPIGGALIRAVILATSGVADWQRLAVVLPPGELAALGFLPVTLTAVALAMAWLLGRMVARGWLFDRAKGPRGVDARVALLVTLLGVPFVPIISLLAGLPFALSVVGTVSLLYWIGARERVGPVRGSRLVAGLLAIYTLASLGFGVTASLSPPLTVFTTAPGIQLGPAIRLGEDDDWLYVAWCDNRTSATQIRKSDISAMAWTVGARREFNPLNLEDYARRFQSPHGVYAACPAT